MAASGAKLPGTGSGSNPFALYLAFDVKDEDAFKVCAGGLSAVCAALTQLEDPRLGALTYCYSRSLDNSLTIYMTEMLANAEAMRTHLTEHEGGAIEEIFSREKKIISPTGAFAVNAPLEAEDVMMGINCPANPSSLNCTLRNTRTGGLCNPKALRNKWYRKRKEMRPREGEAVMLEFRAEPSGDREATFKALAPFSNIDPDWMNLLTAFSSDAFWPVKAPYTDKACGTMMVFSGSVLGTKSMFPDSVLADLRQTTSTLEVVVTTANWENDDLLDLLEHLEAGGIAIADRRKPFAGYLIHPAFTRDWQGKAVDQSAGAPPPPQPPAGPTADPFKIRRHLVTDAAEGIIFDSSKPATGGDDEIHVPLRHLMQKLVRMGRNDKEVAPGMVFAQLGRLRGLQSDAAAMNSASEEEIEKDDDLARRVCRLLETLSSLGYAMPAKGRVPVKFEGLDSLIACMEKEYADVVDAGRHAATHGGTIPYMALQELYKVGDILFSTSMGGLGGVPVALRVKDSFYEPTRSIFGSRKYFFQMVLEVIVPMGGGFVAVPFDVVLDEWTGQKEVSQLPLVHLSDRPHEREALLRRSELLATFGVDKPAYLAYGPGSFFPHGSRGKSGGAGAAVCKAAGGRLMVDMVRGLELGHSPANTADDIGLAIAANAKALRNVQRASREGDSDKQRSERLKSAGLKFFTTLPASWRLLCWPTVVAFSLSNKQWGHVLIDALSSIPCSPEAWEELVLPAKTKEMLLAMTASTQHVDTLKPRYRYSDVVDTKGGGVLFLLYGPPGTGKTLSVEALAARFGRPLYSLSFAELGTSVSELEERLTDVLSLAAHWGALVCLDEGDALVERRQRGQLLLNSMTGVLLRLLETFDGALFITSNRAASFDPAALSRVTLAVRYEPLDAEGKRAVWRNALARILCTDSDAEARPTTRAAAAAAVDAAFDLELLSKFAGSGRAVGAVVRLALGLVGQRGGPLTQEILDDAMDVWRGFHSDLQQEGVAETWE